MDEGIKKVWGSFHLRLSCLRTQHSVREYAGSIPGLFQWIKDPVLLRATAQFTDAAQIWCCRGVACSCSSDLNPSPGTYICYRCGHRRKKKKKKERKTENCHLQWHDGPWGHYAKQNKSNKDKYHYDFSYKTKKQKIKTKNNLKTKNKTKLIDREQTGGFKK